MNTTDKTAQIEALTTELCARIRIKDHELPRLLSAQHSLAADEVRSNVQSLCDRISADYTTNCDQFAARLSRQVERADKRLLDQLEGVLTSGSEELSGGTSLPEIAAELKEQLGVLEKTLYCGQGEKRFLQLFTENYLKKQLDQEKEYAKEYYRRLGIEELSDQIFSLLKELYSAATDKDEVLSKPVVHREFPFYYLGQYPIIPKSKDLFTDPAPVVFPLLLKRQGTSIVCYSGDSNQEEINAADVVANIIYQSLLYQLPEIELHVFSGNANLASFYESNLSHDPPVKDYLFTYSSESDFERKISERIRAQKKLSRGELPVGSRYVHIISVLSPEISPNNVKRMAETISGWTANAADKGIWFTYILSDHAYESLQAAAAFDRANPDILFVGRRPMLPKTAGIDRFCESGMPEIAPQWKAEQEMLKTNILKAIIQPPKEDPDALKLFFANNVLDHTPFNFIYGGDSANTIFMQGMPGAGKSYALKQFILNACEKYAPDELQLILVDLKGGVELTVFAGLPHVQYVISAEGDILYSVFSDIMRQMEERMKILVDAGKNNIAAYKKMLREDSGGNARKLPRLLVVVDECKSLFSEGSRALRGTLENLLRKGRSNGIHFLFATQTDQRGDFSKELFEYYVRLYKINDRRSAAIQPGNADTNIPIAFPTIPETEEENVLGLPRIRMIAERYHQFPCKAIVFNSSELLAAEKYPDFREKFRQICNPAVPSNAITACAGLDFNNIRSMYSIQFNSGYSQNLFVACNFGKTLDGFLHLFFLSLLNQNCKVSIFDPDGKLNALQRFFSQRPNFDYTTATDRFVEQVEEWQNRAAAKKVRGHFLFIASAENYFASASPPKRSGFAARAAAVPPTPRTAEISRKAETEAIFAKAKNDPAAQRAAFAFMLQGKPAAATSVPVPGPAVPVAAEPKKQPELTYQETVEVLQTGYRQSAENGNYLILQTTTPSQMADYLDADDRKKFRFAVFYFSGRGLETKMVKPGGMTISGMGLDSVNPLGYFANTPNTEDVRDVFITFDQFNSETIL